MRPIPTATTSSRSATGWTKARRIRKWRPTCRKFAGKKVGVFFTLGAFPDSPHAEESFRNGSALLGEDCEVVAKFWCQGAIDPKLTEWMSKLPAEHPHAPNPERLRRWAEAAKHPDGNDLEAAKDAFRNVI